jgi:hypothetical protein
MIGENRVFFRLISGKTLVFIEIKGIDFRFLMG